MTKWQMREQTRASWLRNREQNLPWTRTHHPTFKDMLNSAHWIVLAGLLLGGWGHAEETAARPELTALQVFFKNSCLDCHDAETKKGGLDLEGLGAGLSDGRTFEWWVRIHDRVAAGEMPPKNKPQPEAGDRQAFLESLTKSLTTAEQAVTARDGRTTERRMNRYEYENALRDLFAAPWLQVRDRLPEDGESFRFNRIGESLDVSHVQMSRYLQTADAVLREVMATGVARPATETIRYYSRDDKSWTGPMKFGEFNRSPERATFPVLGFAPQPEVRAGKEPMTAGPGNPEVREMEGVGVVASSYEPLQPQWGKFKAPVSGRYRVRIHAHAVWVGPGKEKRWWVPDLDNVSKGRRSEPVTVYGVMPPGLLRRLGNFDAEVEPGAHDMEVWLQEGEMIRPDAVRLFRSRPPNWQNPLATTEGQPGVSFRWLEVEGPLYDQWPTAGHRLLFGDLPLQASTRPDLPVEVVSAEPEEDAARLLERFLTKIYRHADGAGQGPRFLPVIRHARETGSSFTEAMLAGYTAVLCSPEFLYWHETPGALTDWDLADRLASFLINSVPDAPLRELAGQGKLRDPDVLRAQTGRLLDSPGAERFVEAFLDYWLDLRKVTVTSPDSGLYPDYYLDDYVGESAQRESQLFFTELMKHNLPARNLVESDFVMINERLADLYQIAGVTGSGFRRVPVPPDNPRGGLMTQAIVLKVTANGTTTSPVLRGAWITERLLGDVVRPPPPGTPAVEPDIRGATTVRQQLEKHRSQESCASCHDKMDPPGFALESFDVMGGWRNHYRALGEGEKVLGFGKNGQPFAFRPGQPVDPAGTLQDGRTFQDIKSFKKLLRQDEAKIARNLARQLTIYATGAPVRFSDRPSLEAILEQARNSEYGVRSLIHALVQSPLFLNK